MAQWEYNKPMKKSTKYIKGMGVPMANQKRAIELEDLEDVAVFWRYQLDRLTPANELEVAGNMTNVAANDNWSAWYNDSKGSSHFVAIYDLVSDLEMPSSNTGDRQKKWGKVTALLDEM